MSNIIDSIQLSGTTYQIQGSGGNNVVELTQAQYDALVDKDPNTFYIITDATAGDLTQYWTSAQTQSAITSAVSTKQDTLVSGTNIKTINNESILGSGNIDIQGGGKAVSGGTNISITTGETADTINCTLPITGDTNANAPKIKIGSDYSLLTSNSSVSQQSSNKAHSNILFGNGNTVSGNDGYGGEVSYNFLLGQQNIVEAVGYYKPSSAYNMLCGVKNATQSSYGFVLGNYNTLSKGYQFAVGDYHTPKNDYETNFGKYSNSVSASTTFGNSGNTLFSVGNGTSTANTHNAFEIRQNGDIYLTLDGQDVKLQDQLGSGGSSYTAGDGIDITNDVISVTGKVDTSTYNTYTAATDTALASKQTTLTAGTGISIVDNVISATGGGGVTVDSAFSRTSENPVQNKVISNNATNGDGTVSSSSGIYKWEFYSVGGVGTNKGFYLDTINGETVVKKYNNTRSLQLVETSAITTSMSSSSTDSQVPSAKAVYDQLGGLKLVKLTQSAYDALSPNYDSNTLYVIVN